MKKIKYVRKNVDLNKTFNYDQQRAEKGSKTERFYESQMHKQDTHIHSSRVENKLTKSQSSVRLSNFDDSDEEQKELEFNFDDKKVIHLWLDGILSEKTHSNLNFKLDLINKKIIGNEFECSKLLTNCQKHLQNHKLKSIIDLQNELPRNTQIFITINDVRLYGKPKIIEACEQISKKYKYKKIMDVLSKLKGKYYYLISLRKQMGEKFMEWFEVNSDRQILRSQIQAARKLDRSFFLPKEITEKTNQGATKQQAIKKQAHNFKKSEKKQDYGQCIQKQQQSRKKQEQEEDEQQQSQVVEEQSSESSQQTTACFYSFDQNSKNNKNAESKEGEKDEKRQEKNQKQGQKVRNKANESDKKQPQIKIKKTVYSPKVYVPNLQANFELTRKKQPVVLQKTYEAEYLDADALRKWIKNNHILVFSQFSIFEEDNNIILQMKTLQNKNKKLQALNIYLCFQKILMVEQANTENIKKIQQKIAQTNHPYVLCKIINGYMDEGTHEHKLRNLIKQNKISQAKKNKKKFTVLWLQGLKPCVDRISSQFKQFLQHLPKNDEQVIIKLNLDKLEKYLNQERVQAFVKKLITDALQKEKQQHIRLVSIQIIFQKVILKIMVKFQFYDDFKKDQAKFEQKFIKMFHVDQLEIPEDIRLSRQIQQKYIILPSDSPNKKIFIEWSQQAIKSTKQIWKCIEQQKKLQEKLQSFEITFKKGRSQLLKNFIQQIQKDKKIQQQLKNVKITFQGENKIIIIGNNKNAKEVYKIVNQFLGKLDASTTEKTFIVSDAQTQVIQKNKERFTKQIEHNFKLSFILSKSVEFGAKISVGPQNFFNPFGSFLISIQKHHQFLRLPRQTVICLQSDKDLNFSNEKIFIQKKIFFKNQKSNQISTKQENQKQLTFIYCQGFKNIRDYSTYALKAYPYKNSQNCRKIAFIMPKHNKDKFVLEVIKSLQGSISQQKIKIQIHILEQSGEDIKSSLKNLETEYQNYEKETKYYVFDKKEFYYSESGDKKIKQALHRGKKIVHLTNEDLNLQILTHICNYNKKILTHKQSGKQTPIKILNGKCFIQLHGNTYEMPQKQYQKIVNSLRISNEVQVSIGIYELNFQKMKQYNLFSGFQRDLMKKEVIPSKPQFNKIFVNFDDKVNEIQIPYEASQQASAEKACSKLKSLIQAQKLKIQHKFQRPLTNSQFQKLKQMALEFDIELKLIDSLTLGLASFNKLTMDHFLKNLKYKLIQEKQTKYPSTWQPQKNQIQTFIVDKNSKQFLQIQKQFTVGQIKQLIRIQNSIVYKKYEDEKNFLTQLNGHEVKQMMLFHGTRSADPKLIYEDKQQSFNINYTSDNNYLGRGTYFAVKSEYSNNYRYTSGSYYHQQIFEMFYCSVLVGDAQLIKNVDSISRGMRDTDYKNPAQKLRYQSATTFTDNSDIYTVYKNRRAYPHYLIKY